MSETSTQLHWWQQVGLQIAFFFLMTSKSRVILQILLAGCPATWHQAPLSDCIRVEGRKLVCRLLPGSLASWAVICGHVICGRMFIWLGIPPLACMVGQGEKQFTEKYENATHNSSVILFAVDRWEENPIILGSGEYPPIPSQCANRQTHTERHTHLNNYIQVNHSLSNSHTHKYHSLQTTQ